MDEPRATLTEEKLPDGAVRVRLSRAFQTPPPNGERGMRETSELVFREPTAGDVEICGFPVLFGEFPKQLHFDEVKTTAMLARLSGIPLPYIRNMRAADWQNCAWAIAPFFVPGMAT